MIYKNYVLITAARDEEAYIEKTIHAVISQTVLPRKWIIVNDCSTDSTDAIVRRYADKHGFMELIHARSTGNRNFASKVNAINSGYERLNGLRYDYIGILDADITFDPRYYENVVARFEQDPRLGIAGGLFWDCDGEKCKKVPIGKHSVCGAVQLFRRSCYEDIGGLMPIQAGAEDTVAELLARMRGWKVQTFPDFGGLHLKPVESMYTANIWRLRFQLGRREHLLGYHPLFELAKCIGRVAEKPYVFGAVMRWCGYCWAMLRRERRAVADDVVNFLRRDQVQRLKSIFQLKRTAF